MDTTTIKAVDVAPCGLVCTLCHAYAAKGHNIPRKQFAITHCAGCRVRGKECAYIKKQCERLMKQEVEFCFQCPDFPCERLTRMDARYKRTYHESLIANLEAIKELGLEAFMKQKQKEYACPECGTLRCMHNGKCYSCETVESWRG